MQHQQTYQQRPFQGINFKDPTLRLHAVEGGPMVATQSGKIIMEDGRELPANIEVLEQAKIPLSLDLKRDIIRIKVERDMAAEKQEFEMRQREMVRIQEEQFMQRERELQQAESQKWTLPDLPYAPSSYGNYGQ